MFFEYMLCFWHLAQHFIESLQLTEDRKALFTKALEIPALGQLMT